MMQDLSHAALLDVLSACVAGVRNVQQNMDVIPSAADMEAVLLPVVAPVAPLPQPPATAVFNFGGPHGFGGPH
jgi:hypothetical protein